MRCGVDILKDKTQFRKTNSFNYIEMSNLNDILSFATQVAEESNKQMQRLERWKKYISPTIEHKFGVKYDISLDGMYRKEIQDFINKQRVKFNKQNPL